MKKIIIAIDGPAGSGKTSSAKIVAESLGYTYIDTGAMYRAVSLAVIEKNIPVDEESVCPLLDQIHIELKPSEGGQITLLNGRDVSLDIRKPEVTTMVSPVSAMGCVRERMVAMQREMGANGGVVMDGRDIGTVVFPQAQLKLYLVASIDSRANRRIKEMTEKGIEFNPEEIKNQILYRDNYDSTRAISPLCKANDAIEIDTSDMTIPEQTERMLALAKNIINS